MKNKIDWIRALAMALAVSLSSGTAALAAGPGDGLITIETGQTRYGTATPSELPANSARWRNTPTWRWSRTSGSCRRSTAAG